MGIQVYSNKEPRSYPRRDNYEISQRKFCHRKQTKLKTIFFSGTTGPISTKLGTKHPWLLGIEVCSKEGPCPFLRADNRKITKDTFTILKDLLQNQNIL